METSKFNKLTLSESYDIESALSHILSRYNKRSHAGAGSDFRVVDSIILSADESVALSKLHYILKTYKINTLTYSESLNAESALFHLVARYKKDSRSVFDYDYRVLESVALFADQYVALSKLHDIFYNKIYAF